MSDEAIQKIDGNGWTAVLVSQEVSLLANPPTEVGYSWAVTGRGREFTAELRVPSGLIEEKGFGWLRDQAAQAIDLEFVLTERGA